MSARKPSLKTQLKVANATLLDRSNEIVALQKQIDTDGKTKQYLQGQADTANAELAQINAFLDALPTPPADKMADGYTKIKTMTRLMVWLANK